MDKCYDGAFANTSLHEQMRLASAITGREQTILGDGACYDGALAKSMLRELMSRAGRDTILGGTFFANTMLQEQMLIVNPNAGRANSIAGDGKRYGGALANLY